MWTRAFWVGALERAIRTAAQTGLAVFIGDQVIPPSAFTVDWASGSGVVAMAALGSVLMSLAAGAGAGTAGQGTTAFSQTAL